MKYFRGSTPAKQPVCGDGSALNLNNFGAGNIYHKYRIENLREMWYLIMATPALWGKAKSESKSCFQALPALVPRASPSVKMTMWNQPVRTDLCQKVKDSTIIMNIYMMADAVFMMINTFRPWRAWWKRRERPGWERWWTWWSRRRSLNLKKISNNLILVSQSKSVILFQ